MIWVLIALLIPIVILIAALLLSTKQKPPTPEPVNRYGRQWALYVDAETERRRQALGAMQQEDSYWLRDVYERKD